MCQGEGRIWGTLPRHTQGGLLCHEQHVVPEHAQILGATQWAGGSEEQRYALSLQWLLCRQCAVMMRGFVYLHYLSCGVWADELADEHNRKCRSGACTHRLAQRHHPKAENMPRLCERGDVLSSRNGRCKPDVPSRGGKDFAGCASDVISNQFVLADASLMFADTILRDELALYIKLMPRHEA